MMRGRRRTILSLVLLGALGVSFVIDGMLATWIRRVGIDALLRGKGWVEAMKVVGTFWFVATVATVVWVAHPRRGRAAGLIVLAAVPGLVNMILRWTVGRARPFKGGERLDVAQPFVFEPFRKGLSGLGEQSVYSFPSQNVCLGFAVATGLAILFPRLRWLFYGLASFVAVERVAENAHYLSDVVAAGMLGALSVRRIAYLLDRRGKRSLDGNDVRGVNQENTACAARS